MPAKKSIPPGTEFTRLTVISELPSDKGKSRSLVRCKCGTEFPVRNAQLLNRQTKSCGCLQRDRASETHFRHGHSTRGATTRIYRTWSDMTTRCHNPKGSGFENYGGRGITVCERWRNSFEDFHADMGEGKPGWTMHRVDNDLGYFLENMVWATSKFQARHTSMNRVFTVRGVTACLEELCEMFGASYNRTHDRLKLGWSIEKALFTPKRGGQGWTQLSSSSCLPLK